VPTAVFLFCGGRIDAIEQWDLRGPRPYLFRVFQGHEDWITSVVLSADARTLYSSSWDKKVIQWDVQTGMPSRILSEHRGEVWVLALNNTSNVLYSGSEDRTIRAWPVGSQGCATSTILNGHTGAVRALSLSIEGYTLFSSDDDTVLQWDLRATNVVCRVFTDRFRFCRSLYYDATQRLLFGGSIGVSFPALHMTGDKVLYRCTERHYMPLLYMSDVSYAIQAWHIDTKHCVTRVATSTPVHALRVCTQGHHVFSTGDHHRPNEWILFDITFLPALLPQVLCGLVMTYL
jgi:WD40 repeat protein